MANGGVTIDGLGDLLSKLREMERTLPAALADAMREELEIEREESMRRTPVDTNALRGSHRVTVDIEGGQVVGRITVGGVAAPYSVAVHEDLHAIHPVGQAKFLESTVMESKPYMARRIATRLGLRWVR